MLFAASASTLCVSANYMCLFEHTGLPHKVDGKRKRKESRAITKHVPEEVNMKKVNYRSNITGLVKLLKDTKFTSGQLKCLRKTPFWPLFHCLISNELDLNHCMKYDDVIVRIVQTFKQSSGRFYIGDKNIQIFRSDVSLIFGVDCGTKAMDLSYGAKPTTGIIHRMCKDVSRLSVAKLREILSQALKGTKKHDNEEVARLVCMYACVKLFFSTSGETIGWAFYSYMDPLDKMIEYDWAESIRATLMASLGQNCAKPGRVTGYSFRKASWFLSGLKDSFRKASWFLSSLKGMDWAMEKIGSTFGSTFGYYYSLHTNMKKLKRNTEQLNGQEKDINEDVNYDVQRSRKRRRVEVELWQEDVRTIANDVQTLERQVQEVSWMNVYKRVVLGKRVVEKIQEVEKLHENGGFSNGLLIDDPTCGHAMPTAESLAEPTTARIKEKVWNFLVDDAVRKIGVHGMGGIGKTTIIKDIHNQLLDEIHYFDDVIWVTGSKAFEIKNLQRQIAMELNLDLSDYEDELHSASKIRNMLSQKKRYVLILDDLWKAFPLEEVGIPEPTRDNGCKLVLTTRLLEVCTKMNCKTVEMELLTEEEALNLFMSNVEGHQTMLTPKVKEIAKEVAKKCACLPLAIVTMAGCMRGVNDIREWRNARNASQLMDKDERLFEQLKFSYSRLKDEQEQHCFLYCALYPEDYGIGRLELIEYWIAEGLICKTDSREAMLDEGHTMLNKLIKTCLLVEANNKYGEYVKMHDLIREMALKITSTSPRFMVRAGEVLERVPHKDWSEDLQRVSLMWNIIEELPSEPICPRLTTFLFQSNFSKVLWIPDSFFLHMRCLKVLDLSNTAIDSLPNSISVLENLHQLLLCDCRQLKYVPSLEKLKALEHFELTKSQIEEVPQGIEELVNLRKLELSKNNSLGMSPCRKLCRLTQLHYLRIRGTKVKLSTEELLCLKQLKYLEVQFHNVQELTKYVESVQYKSLALCRLEVGMDDENNQVIRGGDAYFSSTGVDAIVLHSDIQCLRIRRWDNHISLSDIQSLRAAKGLIIITIDNCFRLQSIFSSSSSSSSFSEDYHIPLTTIEELMFSNLPNFRVLFDRVVPPHNISFNLKRLKFFRCPRIKNIFPALLLQNFPNLEFLEVSFCKNVEEIIVEVETSDRGGHREDDGNTITLPNLKVLFLYKLPRLNSIYKGIMVCESARRIHIYHCPMLRRLPISLHMNEDGEQASAPPALQSICGEEEWWESLEWDNPLTKTTLQPFYFEPQYSEEEDENESEDSLVQEEDESEDESEDEGEGEGEGEGDDEDEEEETKSLEGKEIE
ncbi:hypothetical protein ACSBR1_019454 [Camellia fascicularis]